MIRFLAQNYNFFCLQLFTTDIVIISSKDLISVYVLIRHVWVVFFGKLLG